MVSNRHCTGYAVTDKIGTLASRLQYSRTLSSITSNASFTLPAALLKASEAFWPICCRSERSSSAAAKGCVRQFQQLCSSAPMRLRLKQTLLLFLLCAHCEDTSVVTSAQSSERATRPRCPQTSAVATGKSGGAHSLSP